LRRKRREAAFLATKEVPMATIVADERPVITAVADPAPLGLAAFALTTFLLSGHNATFIPDAI
jgi:succinate-acetate transporter protein